MRTEVASSLLKSIAYSPETHTLEIEFRPKKDGENGKVYRYADVSQEVYDKFLAAESLGKHFLREIKPAHNCTRVEEKPDAESEKKAATKPQPFKTATDETDIPF